MSRQSAVVFLLLVVLAGCGNQLSNHEKALQVWESNFDTAERLVNSGDAGPELQRVEAFFWKVAGRRGLVLPHTFDNLTVNPQAHSTLRKLREWCDKNCERLRIDPESGEVIVLAAESLLQPSS